MNTPEEPTQTELSPLIIDGPPWEKKHELGFFVAFVETIKAFLFKPALTFSVMRRNAPIADSLVYTVAIQVFTFLWMFAITDTDPAMLLPQDPAFQEMLQLPENFSQIMVMIYPLSVMLLQFIAAFSVHLAMKWRDLQTYDFALIFRVFAYASGTAALLVMIPAIGGILSLFLTIYLGYLGLRTLYGLDVGTIVITGILAAVVTVGLYIAVVLGLTIIAILFSLIL